jgi:hypothetical protein
MDNQDVTQIIRDELEAGGSQERIVQWHRLLIAGVAHFISRFGRLPDRNEIERIGQIVTEFENEDEQPKMH